MDFDKLHEVEPQAPKRKLSRLKRAQTQAEPAVTALHQSPVTPNTEHHALSDRTNIDKGSQPHHAASPSPTAASAGPLAGAPESPHASSVAASPTHSDRLGQSASHNNYWDSEDELEAELTKREWAEGFHMGSVTPSGTQPAAFQNSFFWAALLWLTTVYLTKQRTLIWNITLSADADSQRDNDQGSGSEAGSPAKSGSPEDFDELNSQTQRVLRGIVSIYDGTDKYNFWCQSCDCCSCWCRQCKARCTWSGAGHSEAAPQRHSQQDSEQEGRNRSTVAH